MMSTYHILVFVQMMTDHMLVASYDPEHGWSDPEIKPYGPLCLDPASSCFQYSTNVFEGMKVGVSRAVCIVHALKVSSRHTSDRTAK